MSQEAERFLHAEQSAQQLLEALSSLQQETVSYKTSTRELDIVRQNLVGLIDSIQAIAKDTHEVVKLIKGIGGPEILRSIDSLLKQVQAESEITRQRVERLKRFTLVGISTPILSLIGIVVLLLR